MMKLTIQPGSNGVLLTAGRRGTLANCLRTHHSQQTDNLKLLLNQREEPEFQL